jgi:hypothetical protein
MDLPSNPEHGNLGAIESGRLELTIDDDQSARDFQPPNREHPHREPALIPRLTMRFPDRHVLVGCFKNANQPGTCPVQ